MIGVRNNITSFPIDVTNLNDKLTSAFAGSPLTVNDEKVLFCACITLVTANTESQLTNSILSSAF